MNTPIINKIDTFIKEQAERLSVVISSMERYSEKREEILFYIKDEEISDLLFIEIDNNKINMLTYLLENNITSFEDISKELIDKTKSIFIDTLPKTYLNLKPVDINSQTLGFLVKTIQFQLAIYYFIENRKLLTGLNLGNFNFYGIFTSHYDRLNDLYVSMFSKGFIDENYTEFYDEKTINTAIKRILNCIGLNNDVLASYLNKTIKFLNNDIDIFIKEIKYENLKKLIEGDPSVRNINNLYLLLFHLYSSVNGLNSSDVITEIFKKDKKIRKLFIKHPFYYERKKLLEIIPPIIKSCTDQELIDLYNSRYLINTVNWIFDVSFDKKFSWRKYHDEKRNGGKLFGNPFEEFSEEDLEIRKIIKERFDNILVLNRNEYRREKINKILIQIIFYSGSPCNYLVTTFSSLSNLVNILDIDEIKANKDIICRMTFNIFKMISNRYTIFNSCYILDEEKYEFFSDLFAEYLNSRYIYDINSIIKDLTRLKLSISNFINIDKIFEYDKINKYYKKLKVKNYV